MRQLTPQQRKFCEEFVRTANAYESYKTAYPNCSESTAKCNSSTILKRDYIQNYIEELNKTATRNNPAIADLDECLELLTDIMRDENATNTERTNAANLRLKTLAAYVDRKQVEVAETTINVNIEEDDED